MKKTLKKYPAGTENTLDIVKQHTELLMEHNANLAALSTTVMLQTGFDDYKGKIKSKWNESTAKYYAYLKEHEGEIKEL